MREHTPEGASQKRILSSWPAVARITLMVVVSARITRLPVTSSLSCQCVELEVGKWKSDRELGS
eukprot:scaffold44026_cov153-Skeletonema_marinoi.AAC.1